MDLIHQYLARKHNGEEFDETDGFMVTMFNVIKESILDNSYSTIEASRLLWQLSIYSKGSVSKKHVENIYVSILRNCMSTVGLLEEYLLLGESLAFLMDSCVMHGSGAVKGCQIDLPFHGSQASLELYSKPFSLRIDSMKDVLDLQSFWCSVYSKVAEAPVLVASHDIYLAKEPVRFGEVIASICALIGKCECSTNSTLSMCFAVQAFAMAYAGSITTSMARRIMQGFVEWLTFAVNKMCSNLGENRLVSSAVEASLEDVAVNIVRCMGLMMTRSHCVCFPLVVSVSEQVLKLLSELTSNHELLLHCGLEKVFGYTPNSTKPLSASKNKPPLKITTNDASSTSSSSIAVMFCCQFLQMIQVLLDDHSNLTQGVMGVAVSSLFPGLHALRASCVDLSTLHFACQLVCSHLQHQSIGALEHLLATTKITNTSAGYLDVANVMNGGEITHTSKKARFSTGTTIATTSNSNGGYLWEGNRTLVMEPESVSLKRKLEDGNEADCGAFVHELVDMLSEDVKEGKDQVSVFRQGVSMVMAFEVVLCSHILVIIRQSKRNIQRQNTQPVTRFVDFVTSHLLEESSGSETNNVLAVVSWVLLYSVHRILQFASSVKMSEEILWSSVLPETVRALVFTAVQNVRSSVIASVSVKGRADTSMVAAPEDLDFVALDAAMLTWSGGFTSTNNRAIPNCMSSYSLIATYMQVVSALSISTTSSSEGSSSSTGSKSSTKGKAKTKKDSLSAPTDSDSLFQDLVDDDYAFVGPWSSLKSPAKGKGRLIRKTGRSNSFEVPDDIVLSCREAVFLPPSLAQLLLVLTTRKQLSAFAKSSIVRQHTTSAEGMPSMTKSEFSGQFELHSRPLFALLTSLQTYVLNHSYLHQSGGGGSSSSPPTNQTLSVVYHTVESIFGCLSYLVSQSFLHEGRSVFPIAKHSSVLQDILLSKSTLTPDGVLQSPEECIFRIHFFLTVCNWKESANQLANMRNNESDSAPASTDPLTAAAIPSHTGKIITALVDPVTAVVSALLPHMRKFVSTAVGEFQHGNEDSAEDTQEPSTGASFFSDCDQFGVESVTTAYADEKPSSPPLLTAKEHVLFVELLLQSRTILSALVLCRGGVVSSRDNLQRLVLDLDDLLVQLLPLNILGHTARIRMGQWLTVCWLEQSHLASCAVINRSHGPQAGRKDARVPELELLFQQNDVVTRSLELLPRPFTRQKPSFLIVVSGIMRFVRLSIFSQPHLSLFALGRVLRIWLETELDDKFTQNIVNEELNHLAENGLLSQLMIAHDVRAVESILLPIYYNDINSNLLADYALELIGDRVDRFREDSNAVFYMNYVSHKVVTQLATAPLDSGVVSAAQVLSTLYKRGTGIPAQYPNYGRFLVEGRPVLVYHFLTSALVVNMIQTDVKALLCGKFHMILEHTARAIGVELCSKRESADKPLIADAQLHAILMPLIWDLGAEDPTVAQSALSVLPVFSFMCDRKTWKFAEADINKSTLELTMNECVASLLSDHMLFTMANLLQSDHHTSNQNHQVRCLRCLRSLVLLLKQSDNAKFLPKILVELGIALSSASGRVRLAAVELCGELCNRLHQDVLCANLSSLVVILFPLIEPLATSTASGGVADSEMAVFDLKCHGKLSLNMQYIAKLSRTGMNDRGFSDDIQLLCTAAHWFQLSKDWSNCIRQTAIGIIKNLFLTRRGDIQKAIQSVAYIPNVDELQSICTLHAQELKALTLEQLLKLLCQLVQHDSFQVRILALSRLHLVCRDQKRQLYQSMASSNASELKFNQNQENIMSFLMEELLQLSAREGNSRVQEAIAKCLGELGAIEPGKLHVKLSSSASAMKSGDRSPAQEFQPWFMAPIHVDEFAVYLLEHHLVPGLRSAALAESQDRSGYAIQTMLKHLAVNSTSNNSATIPANLRAILSTRNILEVTEAFWSTQYKMNNLFAIRCPPIYFQGLTFPRWISLWTRFLIKQSRGRLTTLFEGCRGIVRSRSELCQFLLPHLIVDILTHYDSNDDTITVGIVQEITTVLRGTRENVTLLMKENNLTKKFQDVDPSKSAGSIDNEHQLQYNQMCVQSVFGLLDTLTMWHSSATQNIKEISRVLNTLNAAAAPDAAYYSVERIQTSIEALFVQLPNELLCTAAMNIKAYARALRYVENHSREQHRNNRTVAAQVSDRRSIQSNNSTSSGSYETWKIVKPYRDGASGELPVLSSSHLNTLMTIYAKLEDVDALQGTQIMRQILGYKCTPWNRIVELEHADDWLGTLLEYGLLHNSERYTRSLDKHSCRGAVSVLTAPHSAGATNNRRMSTSSGVTTLSLGGPQAVSNTIEVVDVDAEDGCMAMKEMEDLEKGRLKCLIELGHLEAVIDQTLGMSERLPALETTLAPLGVEASWRLMRWDDLNSFLTKLGKKDTVDSSSEVVSLTNISGIQSMLSDADNFQLSIGKLLLTMKHKAEGREDTETSFQSDLRQARIQTMTSLSAASMESYNRAYPLLTRLHILHELESGYDLLDDAGTRKGSVAEESIALSRRVHLNSLCWDERLSLASTCSSSQRSMLFAVRRSILGLCSLPSLIAQNWLMLSNTLRQSGKFDAARMSIRYAESCGLEPEAVLLQECRILKDMGQGNKALTMLEPVEIDVVAINRMFKDRKRTGGTVKYPPNLDTTEKRYRLAERIHLATQLMVDNQQKQGGGIIERYQAVIALNKKWELAYFELARYYEYLYQEAKLKEQQPIAAVVPSGKSGSASSSSTAAVEEYSPSYNYLELCLTTYGNCLRVGGKQAMQVLPRMLTLWLSFTAPQDQQMATRTASLNKKDAQIAVVHLEKAQIRANQVMQHFAVEVPPSTWFMCMPQLVSRTGHRNQVTLDIIVLILQNVLCTYPKQGIWHLAGLVHSLNPDRKKIARALLQETYKKLVNTKPEDAKMLVDSQKFFANLVALAGHQTKEKKLRWTVPIDIKLERFLVPTQAVLHHCNPLAQNSTRTSSSSSDSSEYNTGGENVGGHYQHADMMFIASIHDVVDVAASKAKPKTITLTTICGKNVKFLCKQEKDGDLRKDARMMEFNTVVNRLFQEDSAALGRNLRLRTFAVVCLNEECGVLEWVNNTDCIRTLIDKSHKCAPDLFPNMNYKEIYHQFVEFQTKFEDDLENMMKSYRLLVEAFGYRPCFHRWFLERFPDPTEWLEARNMFTRSAAVWSGVGHVIGLGDRHTENILIDQSNGECVHVDFDCLFDKGLGLTRPEIVPFRLTPNMVDAMGLTGVEGTFRRTLEVCMSVLRGNKDTLMSVLEPFLRDPTVMWSRGGRAQRAESDAANGKQSSSFHDHENKEATAMLIKIGERLNGVYNIQHPHRERFLKGALKRGVELQVTKGIGLDKDESLPLSVAGQVQRLIDEAIAEENLAQLYIGWQPWV